MATSTSNSQTILFAGGGSGGHLFPGIAVAEELLRRDQSRQVLFVGSNRELERRIVHDAGFEHIALPVQSPSTAARHPIRFLNNNWRSLRTAKVLIRQRVPNIAIGLGGFASAPTLWLAARQNLPTVLLEQNAIPGRVTRWHQHKASTICTTFAESTAHFESNSRIQVTGNPLRSSMTYRSFASTKSLLVLGGSQGASALNDGMIHAVTAISDQLSDWTIIHQTGPSDVNKVRDAYSNIALKHVVEPFFSDMAELYSKAGIAVSRAGATTLSELAFMGLPAILIPYPHAVDDHQTANARPFVDAGAARLIAQTDSQFNQRLAESIKILSSNESLRREMHAAMRGIAAIDATERVADLIESIIQS